METYFNFIKAKVLNKVTKGWSDAPHLLQQSGYGFTLDCYMTEKFTIILSRELDSAPQQWPRAMDTSY